MKRARRRQAKRIVILCEGDSEEIAVREFIRRQWEADGLKAIGLPTTNLDGKLEDVFDNVVRFRRDPKVLAVFTLVDLFEMKRVSHKPDDALADKVRRTCNWFRIDGAPPELKDEFKSLEMRSFYHPHISVHEVEAWLLADGKCIGPGVSPLTKAEEKNFQNPPKARVKKTLRKLRNRDDYREVIDGEIMFKRARFNAVEESCPYFKAFYDDLKQVAQRALGASESPDP